MTGASPDTKAILAPNGGSARSYQAMFMPLAALSKSRLRAQWTVSQPHIYSSPR
jgi:hypothetical protein